MFVAIDLPESVRESIRVQLERVRAGRPRARWVPAQNLHLTLEFLGEVPDERLPALDRALACAFAVAEPVRLEVAGAGAFPPGRPARVLWIGIEAGPELEAARRRAAEAAWQVLDGRGDERPLQPHLTVGRCRPPWAAAAVRAWTGELADFRVEPFVAGEASLFESRLGPSGPIYRAAATYRMGRG